MDDEKMAMEYLNRDCSLEVSVVASFLERTQKVRRERGEPIPPEFSVTYLAHVMSEWIDLNPINGHKVEAVLDFLVQFGIVSTYDYMVSQPLGHIPGTVPRITLNHYVTFHPKSDPDFVENLMEELENGPVIGVFPICNNFDLETSATLYVADGDIAMNEADPQAIVALVVLLCGYFDIDGVPSWVYLNTNKRYDPARGFDNLELDSLYKAYAPITV